MRVLWRPDMVLLGLLLLVVQRVTAYSEHRERVSYITRIEDARINTPSQRVHAYSTFDLFFTLHNGEQDVKFTLEPNHDVIQEGAIVEYIDEFGNVMGTETIARHEHKVFKGRSWLRDERGWYHAGWARITMLKDGVDPLFEGAFTLHHDAHHILLRGNFLKTRHRLDPVVEEGGDEFMVVFRDSDIGTGFRTQGLVGRGNFDAPLMCPSDRLLFNAQPENAINRMIMEPELNSWGLGRYVGGMTKRQTVDNGDGIYGGSGNSAGVNLKNTIGKTEGCPTTREVALMGVATDCTYTKAFANASEARANIIQQINSASHLYESTFNITLGLAQLVISDANCPGTAPESAQWNVPCSDNVTIENRLNLFSQWRGTRNNDTNAFWTLLTTCETGSAVGLAWLGQLCNKEATTNSNDGSYVSGANVIAKTDTEWKVIAHEIGHTMGAVHDCTSSTCAQSNTASASQCCPLSSSTCDADGQYIMNPSTSNSIENFSPCSIGNICSAFKRKSVDTSCLTSNKGVVTITEHECGNGIVEEGEDCDCGGTEGCNGNTCCNASTCKFTTGSVCDDANEDCCKNCQFASANTVCRTSSGECDPEEKCSGTNSTCPADVTKPDGESCGDGDGLKCASGQCTSRDQQCQIMMGQFSSTTGSTSNDTYACDDNNCVLTCSSPTFGSSVCYSMQQNFLDGTPCAGDGTCKNGVCKGASALGEVKSWFQKHKAIVIGVASAIGALLLFSLASCIFSRCRRRRAPKNLVQSPNYMAASNGWAPPPPNNPQWGQPPNNNPQWGEPPPRRGSPPPVYPMPPPLTAQPHHNAPRVDADGWPEYNPEHYR